MTEPPTNFWYASSDIGPTTRERAQELLDQGQPCTVFDYPPEEDGRFGHRGNKIEIEAYELFDDDDQPTGEFYFLPADERTGLLPETGAEALAAAEARLVRLAHRRRPGREGG